MPSMWWASSFRTSRPPPVKLPASALPWIVAAAMLFFLGVLAFGLHQGELTVPMKGVRPTLQRAGNPLGFYLLAAFYAALAGLCAWLLLALRSANRRTAVPHRQQAAIRARSKSSMDLNRRFEITQDGRGGNIVARLASGSHAFWWEFGGGNCIAFVSVPTAEQWSHIPALAPHARDAFLQAMAEEVGRRQCPDATIIIGADSIVFESRGDS